MINIFKAPEEAKKVVEKKNTHFKDWAWKRGDWTQAAKV